MAASGKTIKKRYKSLALRFTPIGKLDLAFKYLFFSKKIIYIIQFIIK